MSPPGVATSDTDSGSNVLELALACCRVMRQLASLIELPLEELYTLYILSAYRPRSVKHLTRMLSVRDSRTSKILHSLEARGHITRVLSLRDRRVEEVSLTPRGKQAAEAILTGAGDLSGELRRWLPAPSVLQDAEGPLSRLI